jgi:hypothetical protein
MTTLGNSAQEHVRHLDPSHAVLEARTLALALKYAVYRVRSIKSDDDLTLAIDPYIAPAIVRALERTPSDIDEALDGAALLEHHLGYVRARVVRRDQGDDELVVALGQVRAQAYALVVALSELCAVRVVGDQEQEGVLATWSAARLVTAANRLLPAANRARYREEFHAEICDLAEAGAGRWRQIAYATRVLIRAWGLRRELKTPHPRKASL